MNIKRFAICVIIVIIFAVSPFLNAQETYSAGISRNSGCNKEAVQELINAINDYRADSKNWNTNVTQYEFTLGGVPEEQRGILILPVNKNLMISAYSTSQKFADGTYPIWDHIINGEGPTMRAIKNGWHPSMNKLFNGNEEPPFTMIAENLFKGSLGYTWNDVLEAWKSSTGHNTTLLSRGAISIGCGCADSKNKNGEDETYWVLLVELENSITESDEIMDKYFKYGTFYTRKNNIKRSELSKFKAIDAYEFIEEGLRKIKESY